MTMFRNSIATILVLIAFTAPARADFDLSWHTIDAGGATFSAGGNFQLGGTIGQPDAGTLTGGAFTLAGGFWAGALADSSCPGSRGDANCDGSIDFFDIDPFLTALFDPGGYAASFCGGSICAADTDCSGTSDFFDIDPFLACVFGGCAPCP
jgi:hypothetical protein